MPTFIDFATDLADDLTGKLSDGRIKHYRSVTSKIETFAANTRFSDISANWLQKFENYLRSTRIQQNTINSNMKIIIAFLNRGASSGFIAPDAWAGYKKPRYIQNIPVYLTEKEIADFTKATKAATGGTKTAGYYFLLSCYTGFRISDCARFRYADHVHDGAIVIRAKKNKEVVSLPIHKKLAPILAYCKSRPFDITEQAAREGVKEIANFAGIRKEIKFHSSRHTFAMLLIAKGLSIDEVAHLLGDSLAVARIYARISNPILHKRVMAAFTLAN